MKSEDQLSEFVRGTLASGQNTDAAAQALAQAGWSQKEIDAAVSAWGAPPPGLPPVPRPNTYVSARDALLFGLLFITLGVVSAHIVILGFGIIDNLIPDSFDQDGYGSTALRWPIATLIAFLPLFLWLNRRANRGEGTDAVRKRSLVRRWVASVTMLIAVLVLLGDVVSTVYVFLNGDLSTRFVAKAALVAVMGALVLAYYRDEMDG